MFEKLTLRNFQCHKNIVIEFEKITTLCGKSDVGKSSILRALLLLCRNRPSGTSFIRHGRKGFAVLLDTGNSGTIARKKGEKENSYLLDTEEFKALGQGSQGIPPAIQGILRTSDTNFQGQHDAPFWFAETPGQISRNLNKIVNLDVIDAVLSKAAKRVKHTQAVVEVTEVRVKEAEETVKNLRWVKEFSARLAKVEARVKKVAELQSRKDRLESLLDQYAEAVRRKKELKAVAEAGAVVCVRVEKMLELKAKRDRLASLIEQYREQRKIAKYTIGDFSHVEESRVRADNLAERRVRLAFLVEKLIENEELLCQLRSEEKELKAKLGDKCPACGQTLPYSESSRRTCTFRKRPH